jgi:hypothetical protein
MRRNPKSTLSRTIPAPLFIIPLLVTRKLSDLVLKIPLRSHVFPSRWRNYPASSPPLHLLSVDRQAGQCYLYFQGIWRLHWLDPLTTQDSQVPKESRQSPSISSRTSPQLSRQLFGIDAAMPRMTVPATTYRQAMITTKFFHSLF